MTSSISLFQGRQRRANTVLGTVAMVFAVVSGAQAQSGSENLSDFGYLGQWNSGVTANNGVACVPTSVANGLTYLNNIFNTYSTVNDLATAMGTDSGGTYFGKTSQNEVAGLANYLGAGGGSPVPNIAIVGGQYSSSFVGDGLGIPASLTSVVKDITPTAQFLADYLNAKAAVEVWIQWGIYDETGTTFTPSGGLHSVTLSSIDVGASSIGFIDPWGSHTTGGPTAGAVALATTATLSTVDGFLYLDGFMDTDSVVASPGDLFEAGRGSHPASGRIVTDLVEAAVAPVPEPSTFLTGALLLIPFGRNALRKFRSTRNV